MAKPLVAIVGRPNVGKSTFFNKVTGKRISIVDDVPGVTRDRLYADAEWAGKAFTLIDTGGIEIKSSDEMWKHIRGQAEVAIDTADVIVFFCDAKTGLTASDYDVADMLRKSGKPIVLAVNKLDVYNAETLFDFYELGIGQPIGISAEQGKGIGDLLDEVVKKLPEKEVPDYGDAITFCLIGRPNVGKSSLSNRLLASERTLVSNIAGTTRDSIDTPFTRDGKNYVVIDTAGLVKRGKIFEAIDKYAALRALASIERSEIVLLLINAEEGIIEQDKHVVGYACDNHKAIIVVVNKWDEGKKKGLTKEGFTKEIRKQFKFLEYAPILFTSAKSGLGCQDILPKILEVHEAYNRRIPTNVLNDIIRDAQDLNPAPEFNHARLKISFANQSAVCPPTFIMFCNAPKSAHFSYTRYLENQIRAAYDFDGTPVNIIYRAKK